MSFLSQIDIEYTSQAIDYYNSQNNSQEHIEKSKENIELLNRLYNHKNLSETNPVATKFEKFKKHPFDLFGLVIDKVHYTQLKPAQDDDSPITKIKIMKNDQIPDLNITKYKLNLSDIQIISIEINKDIITIEKNYNIKTFIRKLIQDETNAELKSEETSVKAVVTELPIDFLKTTSFMAIFPSVISFIPLKVLLGFNAVSILIASIIMFLLKNERKIAKERIIKHQINLTEGVDALSESEDYSHILKSLVKQSYDNYIQKSKKVIEFKWNFIQNVSIILGNLLLVAIRYINPSLLGTNPGLKPTWFSLCIIAVFALNWYFSNHLTQKKMDAEKAQFFTKVNEQYQELL